MPKTFWVALVLAGASAPACVQTAGDRSYCNALMAQYDRFSRLGEGFVPPGRVDRELGGQRCREGRIAEGEALLASAVRQLGYPPAARP